MENNILSPKDILFFLQLIKKWIRLILSQTFLSVWRSWATEKQQRKFKREWNSPLQQEMKESRKTQPLGTLQRTWVSAANQQEGRAEREIKGDLVTWTCSHILAGPRGNGVPKCPKIEMLQTLGKGKSAESHQDKCPPCPLQRAHGHCSAGQQQAGSTAIKPNQTKPAALSLHARAFPGSVPE